MTIMTDGYQTTIAFTSAQMDSQDFLLEVMEEKEVTPPGVEGGGANDATTMRNVTWRTMAPKMLKTLTQAPIVVAYDPEVYNEMVAMINDNQQITVTFPDLSRLVFWGWINSFTPNANVEGEQPTANLLIIPSNMDGDNNNAEIAPDYIKLGDS